MDGGASLDRHHPRTQPDPRILGRSGHHRHQWELTPTVTTAPFAVYPAALVVMLIVFGNVSDYTGRLPAILIGM
jgi:hypothetical protein